jgi:hypothetical protein
MAAALRQFVRERAGNRCEYCGLRQEQEPLRFHIEHIQSRQHDGPDAALNLALACHHCNLHKGTNLAGVDPTTRELTRLFHPRLDDWAEHFADDEGVVEGRTAVGRTTVRVLRMNDHGRAKLRRD